MTRAKITVKRWEENTADWSPERREAIKYARVVLEENTGETVEQYAVYKRGQIIDGESAQAAIAAGAAEVVSE